MLFVVVDRFPLSFFSVDAVVFFVFFVSNQRIVEIHRRGRLILFRVQPPLVTFSLHQCGLSERAN